MFAALPPAAPTPTLPPHFYTSPPPTAMTISSPFRPSVPSPLASSPIRTSQDNDNDYFSSNQQPLRQTLSSPIGPSSTSGKTLFKYAHVPARPNPFTTRRREDVAGERRRQFHQSVRMRAEEKKWERRGGGDELLKLEWFRLDRERRQAMERSLALPAPDAAIEDEEELRRAQMQQAGSSSSSWYRAAMNHEDSANRYDVDDLMVDDIERAEKAEVDSLLELMEHGEDGYPGPAARGSEVHFSDDEDDYDGFLVDFISQEGAGGPADTSMDDMDVC